MVPFRDDLFDGGGSGAVGEGGLFVGVRADEGDGIFSLGRAHQRRSVVNQRHPALLSVVNDLLASKLLQITVDSLLVRFEQFAGEFTEDGEV